MKETETYTAPEVTVLEVTVEQGFAASNGIGEWGNGGSIDDEIIF